MRLEGRVIRLSVQCGDCLQVLVSVTSARRPVRTFARRRFRLRYREQTDDYAGSVVVQLPAEVARRVRGRLLRFVVRGNGYPSYRAVWTIRVS